MTSPSYLFLLAAALAACASPTAADSAPVSAGPRTCAAPSISQEGSWELGSGVEPQAAREYIGGPGLAAGDFTGDGLLDVFVARPLGASVLLAGDGGGGLSLARTDLPVASGVAAADLDADGDLDVVLARADSDLILWNLGDGSFTQTSLPDSQGHSTTPSVFDLDNDGDLDIFMPRYVWPLDAKEVLVGKSRGDGHGLYLNDGAAGFSSIADRIPKSIVDSLGFQAAPLDVDADGDLDLYLCNDFGVYVEPNAMLISDGQGGLSQSTDLGSALVVDCMGLGLGDLNGDAALDVFVANLGRPSMLMGDGAGSFYDAGLALGVSDLFSAQRTASWGSRLVDLDGDGWSDLVVTFGRVPSSPGVSVLVVQDEGDMVDAELQADALMLNSGGQGMALWDEGGDFSVQAAHHAVIDVDLDGDGRPELVTAGLNETYTADEVRKYRLSGGCGPGVTLDLPMSALGIGARLQGTVDGRLVTRWMLPSTTYSSAAAQINVGLGTQGVLGGAVLTWADGSTTDLGDLAAGSLAVQP